MDGATVALMEPFDKKRLRIKLDDGLTFLLYKGEVRRYNIKQGSYLDGDTIQEIRDTIIIKRAKSRCLHLLEKRRYTERKLYEKLLKGGYDKEVSAIAVDYAKSFHYVDDASYAYDFIECSWGKESREKVKQKLLTRGIDRDVIDKAFNEFLQYNDEPQEAPLIRALMEKKRFRGSCADISEKKRIYAFLVRKGFSLDSILKEMGCFEYQDS